jgi:hypothetical protein
MPLFWMFVLFALYVGAQGFAMHKAFSGSDLVMLCVAFAISDLLALLSVVFNGMIPPIPLSVHDFWSFMLVFYLGLTGLNAIAIKLTLNEQLFTSIVVSAALNLVLTAILGGPIFYATLGVSNFLFK